MKEKLCVEILTPLALTGREGGERVLRIWEEYLPGLLPDRIGNWEPVRRPFDPNDREATLGLWQWPFLAKRKTPPRMDAEIFMRRGDMPQHAIWTFQVDAGAVPDSTLVRFALEASRDLQADFGCVTLLTTSEIEHGRRSGVVRPLDRQGRRFNFFIASQDLRECIPDLYWLTVLGAPYVELFRLDRLLGVPAFRTIDLGESMVAVQLTSALEDVRDATAFGAARLRAKQFLGEDAFFGGAISGESKRPEFRWQ
jgi:hypothetical protein